MRREERDEAIEKLILEVQRYASPKNAHPQPPVASFPFTPPDSSGDPSSIAGSGRHHHLEEALANARAYRNVRHIDRYRCYRPDQSPIDFEEITFKWMKSQGAGYRDFERWIRSLYQWEKGQTALSDRLSEMSHAKRGLQFRTQTACLKLFACSEYSQVPTKIINDCPGIIWGRPFPKSNGLQISLYTHDHPPDHIHVKFVEEGKVVRLEWPSLRPLPPDRSLSRAEEKRLNAYLAAHMNTIQEKARKVFHLAWLCVMVFC